MIHTEDLSKRFGDLWAVDGLSLDVREGQVLVLLGQNGAGKTTTVRMLTSILRPTHGRASVAGFDVADQASDVRHSVGVLTEQHGLYLRMTGEEYLDFYGRIYNLGEIKRRRRIQDLLEYFGLDPVACKSIGQYSKGMRQKLALARALVHEPPVLLLDEPTSAMDPESARLVRNHIASLRSGKRAIIICTHNLAEAEELADLIAIIYKGKILILGTIQELKEKILGPPVFEVQLAGEWSGDSKRLPKGVTLLKREDSRLFFQIENPQAVNPELIRELVNSQRVQVISVQEQQVNLEQLYLKFMEDFQGGLNGD
jgi:ABC-2 type transport system ATP-binding protein